MSGLSHILSSLENRSLLSLLPGFKKIFLEWGTVRMYETGEKLCEQGKPLVFLTIPLSENVSLVQESEGKPVRQIGYLLKHRSLCLRELLEHKEAPYSAIAESPTTVLNLPSIRVYEYFKEHPSELHYLVLMTNSPSVRSLKRLLDVRKVPQ